MTFSNSLDFLTHNNYSGKKAACLVLFVMIINLVIGGIILPYRQAQACVDVIGGPSTIIQTIGDFVAVAWEKVSAAYESAGTWLGAYMEENAWLQDVYETALKTAWNVLRRQLLNMLVNDIIKWIQGGGTPRFVTDWKGFLKSAADKAAGAFIDKLGLGFLCSKFSFQLRLALSSPSKFDETATCTLSKAIGNVTNFMTDFSKGGWKGWMTISESQNNYMGAYFKTLDQKYGIMAEAADAAKNEATSGAGFLGDKICREIEDDDQITYSDTDGWKADEIPAGAKCNKWETRTPGRQLGDALSQAAGVDIPWLIEAKEFAEYAGAIIDAAINRVIREGVAMVTSTGEGASSDYGPGAPGVTAQKPPVVDTASYEDAFKNQPTAKTLAEQQALLQENLNSLISENQKNLGVLNNIKASQQNSLTILKDHLPNCSLPGGASLSGAIPGTTQVQTTCTITGLGSCPCSATTLENVTLSASGVGEATLERTTTQIYEIVTDVDSWTGMGTDFCRLTRTSVSYRTLSTRVLIEGAITDLNTAIVEVQNELPKVITTNTDTKDYEASAIAYMNAYTALQRGDMTAATSTTETAMQNAKQKAVSSNQTLLSSASTKFNEFVQETMKRSQDTIGVNGDVQTKRGTSIDCTYAPAGFLYTDLCRANDIKTSYQGSLNTCQAASASF